MRRYELLIGWAMFYVVLAFITAMWSVSVCRPMALASPEDKFRVKLHYGISICETSIGGAWINVHYADYPNLDIY